MTIAARYLRTIAKCPARWLAFDGDILHRLTPLFAVAVTLLVGLMIGVDQLIPATVLCLMLIAPLVYYFILTQYGSQFDALFWLMIGIMFLSSIISAITRQSLSFVSTAVLLAAGPFIISSALKLRRPGRNLIPALIVAFFVLGAISTILGRSSTFAAAHTSIIALKPFLLVGFGCALVWSPKTAQRFDFLVCWMWLPMLATACIQWFAPAIYQALLADVEATPESHPFFSAYPRASGMFPQSSVLAAFSAIFGLISLVGLLSKQQLRYVIAGGFYLVLMLMSGQRQELAAALCVLPLVAIMFRWRPSAVALFVAGVVALVSALLALYLVAPDMMSQELKNWGLATSIAGNESARSILYSDAAKIANQYWPIGSGFGTFGSIGSVRFDKSLYFEMGYQTFWWFTKKSYLMDAYWAKYIAETGWLGFGMHLTFYVIILRKLFGWTRDPVIRTQKDVFLLCLMGFSGLAYVLITSPTAFSLTEINGGLIPLMFTGIAWQRVISLKIHD